MSIHLKGLQPGDLGEATIIVGDPGRVELISESWEYKELLVDSREFVVVKGKYRGRSVSICSTGIGSGSTEIAVTELIENGAKQIIRCGGCGAWQDGIQPGEIILNSAMARSQGMLSAYVPEQYPAAANPFLLAKIHEKMQGQNIKVHTGIGLTSETYYLGQGRKNSIAMLEPDSGFMTYWTERQILNCEMETAVLYLLGALYKVPVANSLVVHVSRQNEKWTNDEDYKRVHKLAAQAVLDAALNL
jgi:uridine phosphorylase